MRDIDGDANGNLLDGTLYLESGRVAIYQNGKVTFEKNEHGDVYYYSLNGRLEAVETVLGKTAFAYRVADGQIKAIASQDPDGLGIYDSGFKPLWIKNKTGLQFSFSSGKLVAAESADGALFQYTIQSQANGADASSQLRYVREASGGYLARMALMSDPVKKNQLAESYSDIPLDTIYDSDLHVKSAINMKGESFLFQAGLPTSVTSASGQVVSFSTQIGSEGGIKLGVQHSSNSAVIEQIYDDAGSLKSIKFQDGSVIEVQDSTLEKINLSDGSFIDEIERASGRLLKYCYHSPNGASDWVESFTHIVKHVDADGSTRTYYYDQALSREVNNQYTSPDGRVYRVSLIKNAAGTFDEVYDLQKINFDDGSYLEMENGKPKRYVRNVEEPLEDAEYPVLPASEAYIPYTEINGHQFRSLRIDSVGNILSGEILFNDGTQYFVEDGKLKKQVTPNGQILNFDVPPQTTPPQIVEPAAPLTAAETAYRNELIEKQLDYFTSGIGLDADTGLPLDNFRINPTTQNPNRAYSQATLIGFWAEILTAIASGDYQTSRMTQTEALSRLNQLLVTYREVQRQIGWNGFVSFFDIVKEQKPILDAEGMPTGQTELVISYKNSFDHYGFGDALNLALSLATVVGAFKNKDLGSQNALRDQIVLNGESILASQEPGYAAFYNTTEKRFMHTRKKNAAGVWIVEGFMDRMMNEFRPGMMWLLATHPQYRETLNKLDISIKSYVTQDGEVIENAAPWDGGAFQMFWPLIHVDETKYAEFSVVQRNFLKSQQDYVQSNGIAGLLSAGARPGAEYEGKIGLKDAAETDDPLIQDTGSLYGLAGAFAVAPHYALQFFKNIENYLGSGLRTNAGLIDAVRVDTREVMDPVTGVKSLVKTPVFSDIFYGVDQSSLILSMLGTSQNYFKNYLQNVQADDDLNALYESIQFNLKPADNNSVLPPSFGVSTSVLYDGGSSSPDGANPALIRKPAILSSVTDPELGVGDVYEYLTPAGNFHHLEIEFQDGAKKLNLREYADLPGRRGIAKVFLEKEEYSLFDAASQWGAFYSGKGTTECPQGGCGFGSGAFSQDAQVGETIRFNFDFRRVDKPVGLWAKFVPTMDMSDYDMVTVPVKVNDQSLTGKIRLKFELKGVGEIYVSPIVTRDWQYLQIPVRKTKDGTSTLRMNELAIVILSETGAPIQGQIEIGSVSAMKIRRDSNINWQPITNFTNAQLRSFLINKGKEHIGLPAKVTRQEVLEDFEIDSTGKLIRGVLKKANGEVQFYDRGLLRKWTFLNGRTVTFAENGLADFIIDLSKGRLDISKFYFDQSFAGKIYSFVVQENDRKRIFNNQGQLTEMIDGGRRIILNNGLVSEIQTDEAILKDLVFATDGTLTEATAILTGGATYKIKRGAENTIQFSNGVKVTYRDELAIKTERADGVVTNFEYTQNPDGVMTSAKALWIENGISKEMILGEYLEQPERQLERAVLTESIKDVLTQKPNVFTLMGALPSGELMQTYTQGESMANGQVCSTKYCWVYKYNSINGPVMGIVMPGYVPSLNDYDFMYARLRHSAQTPDQSHPVRIQSVQYFSYSTQGVYAVDDLSAQFQSYSFGISNRATLASQVTIEMMGRLPEAVGVYNELDLAAMQYVNLKNNDEAFSEIAGSSADELRAVWNESNTLKKVGTHIANKQSLSYAQLAASFDSPARLVYQPQTDSERVVSEVRRVDGTEVKLVNGQVSEIRTVDGTVHEYDAPTENASTIQVRGIDAAAAKIDYQYGALRKVIQSDGRQYDLSYEFDAEGKEITVFKDSLSGEVRRFKDGKLIASTSSDHLETLYKYTNGQLIGAELTYHDRVINSTSYSFKNDETIVTDSEGTTWFYGKNGEVLKHLTKEGYLYQYADFTQSVASQQSFTQGNFKNTLLNTADLRAVNLAGYEIADGSRIIYDLSDEGKGEVHLASGDQGVNLLIDHDQKIKNGQIQFLDGLIIQIENNVPKSGRLASGELFTINLPSAEAYELLQNEQGAWTGFRLKINNLFYSYDSAGKLLKVESDQGVSDTFTYTTNAAGVVNGYTRVNQTQIAFNGVPFPKQAELFSGASQKLMDSGTEVASHEGSGFLVGAYRAGTNQWDIYSGSFASGADRLGLKHFLSEIKSGDYVAASVSGDAAFSNIDDETLALFEGLGAGKIRQAAAAQTSWQFFGNESLSLGQGSEKVGAVSFSTLTTTTTVSTAVGSYSQFKNVPMFFNVPTALETALSRFLVAYQQFKIPSDMQTTTVYNNHN